MTPELKIPKFKHTLSIITNSGNIKLSVETENETDDPFLPLCKWFNDVSDYRSSQFSMEGMGMKLFLTRSALNLFTIEVEKIG